MKRKLFFYGAFIFMLCIPSNSVAAEVNTFSVTQQKKQITGTVVDSEGFQLLEQTFLKRNNKWNNYRY